MRYVVLAIEGEDHQGEIGDFILPSAVQMAEDLTRHSLVRNARGREVDFSDLRHGLEREQLEDLKIQ